MALATTFWNSSTSTTPGKQVNVAQIKNLDTLDVPAFNNSPADYQLLFTYVDGSTAPVSDKLHYTTSGLRNAAKAAILAIIGTTTV